MSTVIEVQLEWKYTPKSYFEEPIQISSEGFELSIYDGVALAKIDPLFHAKNPEIKENLTNLIASKLHAVQIMSHVDFTLSKPRHSDLRKDGRKNIFLAAVMTMSGVCTGNLVIRDKDGNIISDSKQDRLDKQKWFAEAIDKHRKVDGTLDQMLKSYHMAVKDPNNELVHLYELRDALSARFGKQNAIRHLGITDKEWDVIGDLANKRPLKEGRHRGQSAGVLRPAEKNELELARKAVLNLVEKYLIYLETA